jgi:hypothetical protein
LSGWPSPTDSEEKTKELGMGAESRNARAAFQQAHCRRGKTTFPPPHGL